jgi:hypothetical protein
LFWCLIPVACGPNLANRAPNTIIVLSRVVALPAVAISVEVDASDQSQWDEQRENAMFSAINPELQKQAREKGALAFPEEQIKACGKECSFQVLTLRKQGISAAMEIAVQMEGMHDYHATSVADWRIYGNYAQLRKTTGADYALFVLMRDLRETTGRGVANFFTGRHTYFKQVGVACVADLAKRSMVWCHTESDAWGDLRNPQEARRAVQKLLSDLAP